MVNNKDLLILSCLRKNARETLTNMSKETMIPISTLYERIKCNGIIKKYTSILDFSKLGFELCVNIMIKVRKSQRKLLRDYVMKCYNVSSAYVIDNHFDLVMECFFRNTRELYHFLDNLDDNFKQNKKEIFYVTNPYLQFDKISLRRVLFQSIDHNWKKPKTYRGLFF